MKKITVYDATATFGISTKAEFHRVFQNFERERREIERLVEQTQPDDVVFNVGAAIGLYTCLLADNMRSGTVISFEPSPANSESLRANINRNGSNATVCDCALSDENGDATLAFDSDDAAGESGTLLERDWNGTSMTVPLRRGDDLCREDDIPTPTVVKIDVEGAEYDVIQGLQETLASDACRLVVCELHPGFLADQGLDGDDVAEALRTAGFDIERDGQRLWATKPA
jgi:FkbM family methyltransferase